MDSNKFLSTVPDFKSGNWTPYKKAGDFIFFSSQIGVREDGKYSNDADEQISQTFINFDKEVKNAGIGPENIVQFTMYVSDRYYLEKAIEFKNDYFKDTAPAFICLIKEFGHPNHILNIKGVGYKGN